MLTAASLALLGDMRQITGEEIHAPAGGLKIVFQGVRAGLNSAGCGLQRLFQEEDDRCPRAQPEQESGKGKLHELSKRKSVPHQGCGYCI